MKVSGLLVKHKVFGKGEVIGIKDDIITIKFQNGKKRKKFMYPSACGTFLEIYDEDFIEKVKADKMAIAKKREEERIVNKIEREEEQRKRLESIIKKSKSGKSSSKGLKVPEFNNIAFKCNFTDGYVSEDIKGFSSYDIPKEGQWHAYAGVTKSGKNKGKPKVLRNVRENSLAIFTARDPHMSEKDRFIFGIFLVDGNYKDDNISKGYIGSDPKYKIRFSLEEAENFKFWDYYCNPNKPDNIFFGSGLHRYLSDIQGAQILRRACEIKEGTEEENLSKEFFENYCKIRNIDIDSLPKSSGALSDKSTE